MFIGHLALGFAAKKAAPRTSLGTLFLAAQLPDLLWPVFLLLGLESAAVAPGNTVVSPLAFLDYPLSHSLLADVGWGFLLAGVYAVIRKNYRGALWLWVLVVSHWVLDFVSHGPDMPLYPSGHLLVGLGLWNSLPATLLVELTMFAAGVAIYARATRPRDRIGSIAFGSLAVVLVLIYLVGIFGPPPPNITAVALAGLAGGWLFLAWAYWADRHRQVVPSQLPAPSPRASNGVGGV